MSAPTMLDRLRDAVQREGGEWTTDRASDALHPDWITPGRARILLNDLAEEGLLVKHGKPGHAWTPATRPPFPEAVLRALQAIPGVSIAEALPEDPDGTIGVRYGDDHDAWFVTVTR